MNNRILGIIAMMGALFYLLIIVYMAKRAGANNLNIHR